MEMSNAMMMPSSLPVVETLVAKMAWFDVSLTAPLISPIAFELHNKN
jgi:hypothetical protein